MKLLQRDWRDRIRVTGALTGSALDQRWDAADLLVLPSRVETYGLVVTEALARGIPAIVSAGTGAVEALQQGATTDASSTQTRQVRQCRSRRPDSPGCGATEMAH